jgi:hypothetical protein
VGDWGIPTCQPKSCASRVIFVHARARNGRKSSAVTLPFVTCLIFAAVSQDGMVSPRRSRLMVDRSQPMRLATASSDRSFSEIQSASVMAGIVYQIHMCVKRNVHQMP